MILKGTNIKNWAALLTQLNIDPIRIDSKALEQLSTWCCKHIKSEFKTRHLKTILALVNQYLTLKSLPSPMALVDAKTGDNALHQATKNDMDGFIHDMLQSNPSAERQNILDSRTLVRNTALHLAALFGSVNSLEVLLEYGANPNLINQANRLPIHVCAQSLNLLHQKTCMLLLLEKTDPEQLSIVDVTGDSLALSLMAFDDGQLAGVVLRKNPDLLHMRDRRDQNLLHRAIFNRNLKMVHYLLDRYPKAFLLETTDNDSTALHLACRYDSEDGNIIRLLLQQEACRRPDYLNMHDEHGYVALQYLPEDRLKALGVSRMFLH